MVAVSDTIDNLSPIEAALSGRLTRSHWPTELAADVARRLDDHDYREMRPLLLVAGACIILSSFVEVVALPDRAGELFVMRLVAVLPFVVAAWLMPRRLIRLQQVLACAGLMIFGFIMLHASQMVPAPTNAFMAMGVATLVAIALPILPLPYTGLLAFALIYTVGMLAGLYLERPDALFNAAFGPALCTFTIAAVLLASRVARLKQQTILLMIQAERRNGELVEINRHLDWLSRHDPLTELPNRRQYDFAISRMLDAASASETRCVAVMMADIDHFKAFNDRHGHHAGDDRLRVVAKAIREVVEPLGGMALRYGGEEFAILAPVSDSGQGLALAETIRTSAGAPPCTLSLGLALHCAGGEGGTDRLLERADAALYEAKAQGRDRTVAAGG